MHYQKKGLQDLLGRICAGEVERLVLTHQDRLLRFGADLIFSLCDRFGTDVVLIEATEGPSFEAELVQDVLEIITVFSARLYGARSPKPKTLMDCMQEVTKP
jgi:putative resolvase